MFIKIVACREKATNIRKTMTVRIVIYAILLIIFVLFGSIQGINVTMFNIEEGDIYGVHIKIECITTVSLQYIAHKVFLEFFLQSSEMGHSMQK